MQSVQRNPRVKLCSLGQRSCWPNTLTWKALLILGFLQDNVQTCKPVTLNRDTFQPSFFLFFFSAFLNANKSEGESFLPKPPFAVLPQESCYPAEGQRHKQIKLTGSLSLWMQKWQCLHEPLTYLQPYCWIYTRAWEGSAVPLSWHQPSAPRMKPSVRWTLYLATSETASTSVSHKTTPACKNEVINEHEGCM